MKKIKRLIAAVISAAMAAGAASAAMAESDPMYTGETVVQFWENGSAVSPRYGWSTPATVVDDATTIWHVSTAKDPGVDGTANYALRLKYQRRSTGDESELLYFHIASADKNIEDIDTSMALQFYIKIRPEFNNEQFGDKHFEAGIVCKTPTSKSDKNFPSLRAELSPYIDYELLDEWQHVTLPLSALNIYSANGTDYTEFDWNEVAGFSIAVDDKKLLSNQQIQGICLDDIKLIKNVTSIQIGAPANFTAETTTTSVSLSWSGVSGADGYYLYKNGEKLADIAKGTTSYTDTDVTPDTAYTYEVSAYNADGETEKSSVSTRTKALAAISAPRSLTSRADSAKAELAWEAPEKGEPTSYNIYRDGVKIGTSDTTSYTDNTVSADTLYVYKVHGVDIGGESDEYAVIPAQTGAAEDNANTAPVIVTAGSQNQTYHYGDKFLLTAYATDADASTGKAVKMRYYIDAEKDNFSAPYKETTRADWFDEWTDPAWSVGEHSAVAMALDESGNSSAMSYKFSINADTGIVKQLYDENFIRCWTSGDVNASKVSTSHDANIVPRRGYYTLKGKHTCRENYSSMNILDGNDKLISAPYENTAIHASVYLNNSYYSDSVYVTDAVKNNLAISLGSSTGYLCRLYLKDYTDELKARTWQDFTIPITDFKEKGVYFASDGVTAASKADFDWDSGTIKQVTLSTSTKDIDVDVTKFQLLTYWDDIQFERIVPQAAVKRCVTKKVLCGSTGNEISSVEGQSSVSAEITFENTSSANDSAKAVLAVYGSKGELVSVCAADITVGTGTNTYAVPAVNVNGGVSAKIIVLEDDGLLTPYPSEVSGS